MRIYLFLITGILSIVGCKDAHPAKMMSAADSLLLAKAHENAILANEGFIRSEKFVHGWLEMAAAADNYPLWYSLLFSQIRIYLMGQCWICYILKKNSLLELTPFPIPIPFLKRIFKMKN